MKKANICLLIIASAFTYSCHRQEKTATPTPAAAVKAAKNDTIVTNLPGMDVSKTITGNVSQPGQFTIFLGMLQTVHYDSLLRIAKYHTLFLPDNASLAKEEAMIDKLSMPQLKELVGHHIVEGSVMSSDLTDGKRLKTLAGDELVFSNKEDIIRIGEIRITKADQLSNNGVIHVVNGLLMPVK